ncbi:MAG TPA: cyclic nucleotide-binding domain-containing protein [Acidimicrobiia bacterium]|jgi:CRP-like cAMP-binding protein|nr:cyclic nucleotide-binding domain-containing protein [Acidimicrobiia bacterium]
MQSDSDRSRIRQQLAGHPFMQGLEPHYVDVFVELGRVAEFEARDIIFRTGQPADTFYLVRSGVVALQVEAGGAYPRTISHLTEGSALGWSWLFEPHEWQFDAVAQTPVRTIAFDAVALRDHFSNDPICGYHIMARVAEVMARRLHATRHQLLHQAP